MAHRDWGQLGFADHMVMRHGRPNELLTRLSELIDWAALGRIVSVLHDLTKQVENERLYEALKQLNAELEQRVIAATADLAEQNARLQWQSHEVEPRSGDAAAPDQRPT